MNKIAVYTIICLILLSSVVPTAIAQSNVDENEVFRIIELDQQSRSDVVREWVNSPASENNTQIKSQAEEWLGDVQEEEQNIKEEFEGSEEIVVTDRLTVLGYDFDKENETIRIALQSDRPVSVSITDLGSQVGSERYSWNPPRTVSGTEVIEHQARIGSIEGTEFRAVSVADNSERLGVRLTPDSSGSFLEDPTTISVILSIIISVLYFAYRDKKKINSLKSKNKGKMVSMANNDMYIDIPIKGGDDDGS